MEQLDYNLLFRWFVGMDMDEPIWAATVFSKNRDRLLNQDIARSFFRCVLDRAAGLMSDEHFTVDGTLIEAWASQKSFQRKEGGLDEPGTDFRGQTRKNETHRSRPIQTPGCIANRRTPSHVWHISDTCSSTIGTGSSPMPWLPWPTGTPNERPPRAWLVRNGNARPAGVARWAPTKPTTPAISSA
jgi:hypothetical protein